MFNGLLWRSLKANKAVNKTIWTKPEVIDIAAVMVS